MEIKPKVMCVRCKDEMLYCEEEDYYYCEGCYIAIAIQEVISLQIKESKNNQTKEG